MMRRLLPLNRLQRKVVNTILVMGGVWREG